MLFMRHPVAAQLQVLVLTAALMAANAALGATTATPAEIRQLIDAVASSGCEFERNDKRYPAPEAAKHLESKLETAAKSWFAPAREKWTAEMFIGKIATGSSLSGDPYWIICKDQPRVHSDAWLTGKLKDLRTKNQR
jgi:hypothetical protein